MTAALKANSAPAHVQMNVGRDSSVKKQTHDPHSLSWFDDVIRLRQQQLWFDSVGSDGEANSKASGSGPVSHTQIA